ncbi:MAG: lysophospholipid acyltransferase family protein [Mariprofundaceae bacterium]
MAIQTLFWLIRLLPARIAGGLGAGLGRMGYLIDKRHREIALRNVQRVFPERDRSSQKRIARESFAELGRVIFEMPHVFLRSEDFIRSCLHISGSDHLRKAANLGKGVIVIGCHQANWEMGAMVPALLGYTSHNMYRSIRPKAADDHLRQWRSRFGTIMHARLDSSIWISRALKLNSCVGFMLDQHVSEEFGIAAPFMGHPASTTIFPAQLAMKRGIPIVPITAFRRGRGFQFDIRIHPMIRPDREDLEAGKENTILKLTTRANQVLGDAIQKQPECWLWSHRRWRTLEHETVSYGMAHDAP